MGSGGCSHQWQFWHRWMRSSPTAPPRQKAAVRSVITGGGRLSTMLVFLIHNHHDGNDGGRDGTMTPGKDCAVDVEAIMSDSRLTFGVTAPHNAAAVAEL